LFCFLYCRIAALDEVSAEILGDAVGANMKFTGGVSDPVERLVGRSLIVLSVLVKGEPLFSVNSSLFLELRKMSALSYPYESSICLAGNGIGFLANLGIPSLQDK
jgi:hypothetical protein